MNDIVADDIFDMFPGFARAVIIAENLYVSAEAPGVADLLASAQTNFDMAIMKDRIAVWDEAHVRFGSNPKRFPPSIRSLAERVQRGKSLPLINAAVGVMNTVSLKFGVPVGGDDLDAIAGDLCLGRATGEEHFIPLGSDQSEAPLPDEPIYFDTGDGKVMCRRWNWRNGDETKVTTATKRLLVNVDGLGIGIRDVVEQAAAELAECLRTECGATARCDVLHAARRRIVV